MNSTPALPALLLVSILSPAVAAQWSAGPAVNLAASDRVGEGTQPKLAARADGGFYLSWFDSNPSGSPPFGYDVYLQRFDSAGNEQWAHNGVRVADRGFSSTTDYDLAVDTGGNALLAFRDDRGTGIQVTAARYDAGGNALWGASGVQLTSTTDFIANPKIAGTSDGNAVVAWIQASSVRLRKLDPAGVPLWGADVVLTPGAGSYSTGDLDAADAGACILSLVHQTGSFSSPRHLLAQKFDAGGTGLWGASPLPVFDGGSLQIGNFPDFELDGSGGAVFAWYSASPALECFAQRVSAAGAELFPHDGVSVSSVAGNVRVAPAVSFDAASQSTYVFYVEKNALQSQCGVSAQAFDASGARQWGAAGQVLVPLGTDSISDVESLVLGSRIAGFWMAEPGFGQDVGRATLLDASGSVVVSPFEFSSTPAVKYRLQAERSPYGHALLAWRDERGADADVYVQDVLPSGILGGLAATVARNGSGANTVFYTRVTDARLGGTWTTSVGHAHHPGANATLILGRTAPASGTFIGAGEVLVGGAPLFTHGVPSSGSADLHSFPVPVSIDLVGITAYTQALIVGGGLELGNALDVTAGL